MASGTMTGQKGVVKLVSEAAGNVTAWSHSKTATVIETAEMSTTSADMQYFAGMQGGSGTIDFNYNAGDAGQIDILDAMETPAAVVLHEYIDGTTTSNGIEWTGTVIFTDYTVSSPVDGMITVSTSYSGILTQTTI